MDGKYKVLEKCAEGLKGVGYIAGVLVIFGVILSVIGAIGWRLPTEAWGIPVGDYFKGLFSGVYQSVIYAIVGIAFFTFGELIELLIDIEKNTRPPEKKE